MDIALTRLKNQHVTGPGLETPGEIVAWMGAMQAQDLVMAKWAVGIRLPGATNAIIEAAMDAGEIIRTHVLRPTWHFVSADDIYWLLALTAPQIKASLRARHNQLGLTDEILTTTNKIVESALRGGGQLARETLVEQFEKAGITDEDNRAAHLLLWAELDGIICSGSTSGAKQTYALLEEKVPATRRLARDEALATLARRYFTSHGPATIQDFVWWSGLYVNDARHALEMARPDLASEWIASREYWFAGSSTIPHAGEEAAYLLPAFDEFLISYKDRGALLASEHHARTISSNGIFRPVVVVDGRVNGIWKRSVKKGVVLIEVESFNQPTESTWDLVAEAASKFGRFLGKEAQIHFNPLPT